MSAPPAPPNPNGQVTILECFKDLALKACSIRGADYNMAGSEEKSTVKAIILSAGQGRRLGSLTASIPKCLLPISGKPIIEWQIDVLLSVGINQVTVVTGFQSGLVEMLLQHRYKNDGRIHIAFNPFFSITDNLVSCWIARSAMDCDFLLLNGDTLFEETLLAQVLNSDPAPVTLGVDQKPAYDADDMKVQLDENGWIKHVGKTLRADQIDAESVGLVLFRERGPLLFRDTLEEALRHQTELKAWYLSIIENLAGRQLVKACFVPEGSWCEIDFPADLTKAEALFGGKRFDRSATVHS
ncbi:MAG TPA: phosphocholine cytidylyltransferase family protein [Nitrosospira sp.]|nr:phosphocholine cytidylyltransferase family protein [Nitrosospira sp.]